MLTVYNEKKKKLFVLRGNAESILRTICEENSKDDSKLLFSKKVDDIKGKVTFKSLSSTEAKTNIGFFYFWKNYILDFEVS